MIRPETLKKEVEDWATQIGVRPKEVHVRKMKNKWASCSSRGRLTFSHQLLKRSPRKRHEVIVHELLHLRYPNHGKMFHSLLRAYLNSPSRPQ